MRSLWTSSGQDVAKLCLYGRVVDGSESYFHPENKLPSFARPDRGAAVPTWPPFFTLAMPLFLTFVPFADSAKR